MEDIFDLCQEAEKGKAFLLLGHRGCGKSTELNKISTEFEKKGYPVRTITCSTDLDLFNIVYSDLFILMGEALIRIAADCKCRIREDLLHSIMDFWDEGNEVRISREMDEFALEAGFSSETPGILGSILKLFAKINADLKFNEETRKEYRKKISNRSSEWVRLLGLVSEEIVRKTGGKSPIIIFEDLDKLNPEDAWSVFYNYAAILSGMPFPIIYTFPIGLSYDSRFAAMDSYFITKTLPMIKIETIEGQSFAEGIAIMKEIIKKRADLTLFEAGVLEHLIRYTGGSLRDLFHTVNASAKRAERRKSTAVSMEDAERALDELQTSLTRRIEKKDYLFLLNIYRGNKELIEDTEKLLKMLQASVVLEYNGKRWHNVHPLVARFLDEQGL